MKRLIVIILITITAFFASGTAYGQDFVRAGEELIYEVSFFGVKLGSIKMITEGYETLNGKQVVKVKSILKSYDGIPFVDLNVIFQSWMNKSMKYSHQFVSNTKDNQGWYYEKIIFDQKNKEIDIKGYRDKKVVKKIKIKTSRKWSDGLSLFYVARRLLNIKKNIVIPTLMDTDTVFTVINFTGRKVKVDIDAVSYPVRTVYFNGNANWTGVYGMTGEFEGWFSDDEAKVPIKANMKVYVGSVDIELKHWKRKGWGPPK